MAVVGATGSGKTTLGHLLTRLYDVTDGQVGWVTTDPTQWVIPCDCMWGSGCICSNNKSKCVMQTPLAIHGDFSLHDSLWVYCSNP